MAPKMKYRLNCSHSQVCSEADRHKSTEYNAWKPVSLAFLSFLLALSASIKVWRQKVDGALAIRLVSSLLWHRIFIILACSSKLLERLWGLWRLGYWDFVLYCSREETQPKSVAPKAAKETTLRPRKRKADVAIVRSLKGLQTSLQMGFA